MTLCPLLTFAQFDFSKKISGMTLNTGRSNASNDPAAANPPGYISASAGVYHYFNINPRNESLIAFHYLRAELNYGFRSGLFTVNALNQTATLTTRSVELALIVPLSWEVSDHVASNIGIGGSIGYVTSTTLKSDVPPLPAAVPGESLRFGFLIDYHLLFIGKSNAVIGTRLNIQPSTYSYADWSVYFGFSPPTLRRKKNPTS